MNKTLVVLATIVFLAGCTPVAVMQSKNLPTNYPLEKPKTGNAGVYIYRDTDHASNSDDFWVDNDCIGNSLPNEFYYKEVQGNQEHTFLSSYSVLSKINPVVSLYTLPNKTYFIKEGYIEAGVTEGGNYLSVVPEDIGLKDIAKLKKGNIGNCHSMIKPDYPFNFDFKYN